MSFTIITSTPAQQSTPSPPEHGWIYRHTMGPVVNHILGPAASSVALWGAKKVVNLVAFEPTPPILQTALDSLGQGDSPFVRPIATKVANAVAGNKVLFYRGIDLNPLHWTERKDPSAIAAAKKAKLLQTQASLPVASPSKTEMEKAKADVKIQAELAPKNIEKYKNAAKKKASEVLYPVITNYARAYWLLTNVLGIKLDKNGKNNQALMEVVNTIRCNSELKNQFSLKIFIKTLEKRGIKISAWQNFKLFVCYYLIGSWTSFVLIPSICDKGIDILYDMVFGDFGKKQENLLVKGSKIIASFLEKHAQMLEEYRKNTSPGKSQEDLIADLLQEENLSELYQDFSKALVNNFLPSINRNLIDPQIEKWKTSMGITPDSSNFARLGFFFLSLPLKIISWIAWLIDKPIRRFAASLISDTGPLIVECTVKTLQTPTTQMALNETILELLQEMKKNLDEGGVTDEEPPLPFSAAKNSIIHIQLKKLSENLHKILALKTSDPNVDSESSLEKLLKRINSVGGMKLGERYITDPIIGNALLKTIPDACMTFLNKYLHPKQFTEDLLTKLINTTCDAFAPTPAFTEKEKAKKEKIDKDLHDVTHQLTTMAVKEAVKETIEEEVQKKLIPEHLQCPRVEKDRIPIDQLIDIEDEIEKSLVPRIRDKYIKEGIACIYDPIFVQFGLLHIIKLIPTII